MSEPGSRPDIADDGTRAKLALIQRFCTARAAAVLFDEASASLMDVHSAKAFGLGLQTLMRVEEKQNRETGASYLLLVYDDGRQLALTDVGLAFPPDFRNTGPLPELPSVVCFRDFTTLFERFKHQVYGHPDQQPDRDLVRLLMLCIAILDGARAMGFDVGREEKEVEWQLERLEKQAPPRP